MISNSDSCFDLVIYLTYFSEPEKEMLNDKYVCFLERIPENVNKSSVSRIRHTILKYWQREFCLLKRKSMEKYEKEP
jgi:hypothetical protein